ncbi:hypothetical protein CXG81DRAFT_4066, partial [Caulochytrium protostelioides]
WVPLEGSPESLDQYLRDLGVQTALRFGDVYGFDDDALSFVPRPVHAVLALFPLTPKLEAARQQRIADADAGRVLVPPVEEAQFIHQTIPNACGTIAVLHALLNNLPHVAFKGPLAPLFEQLLEERDPAARAALIEGSEALAKAHHRTAHAGGTAAPDAAADTDIHFTCFVLRDGQVWELDGRQPMQLCHGDASDLLKGAIHVVQQRMAEDPDNINYTLLTLS